MKTIIAATLSGVVLMTAMGYASANPAAAAPAQKKQDIFTTLASTKVSLDDAIKTAEHTVSGKLVSADLGNDGKSSSYRIAIADNNSRTLTFMKIDAASGKVLASRVYHPDNRAANAAGKTSAAAHASKTMKNAANTASAASPMAQKAPKTGTVVANPLKAPTVATPAANPLKTPTKP